MLTLSVAHEHSDLTQERESRSSLRFKAMKLDECRACPIRTVILAIPSLLFSFAQALGFSRRCQRPQREQPPAPKVYPGYVLRGVKIKSPAA